MYLLTMPWTQRDIARTTHFLHLEYDLAGFIYQDKVRVGYKIGARKRNVLQFVFYKGKYAYRKRDKIFQRPVS